ncbi:MAG: pilus assembly protein PilM [Bacillaceae bacterium]|nr:pilus assembly protein PilM [Bacillaceae bacterium]
MTRKISDGMKKYYLSQFNPFRHSRWDHTRVGIQIGEKQIKLVVLKKRDGKWELAHRIDKPLPGGLVQNGKVMQPERLGFMIREMFVQNGIKKKSVSVFVEELPFFIRHIHLPPMSKKETRRAIRYRAYTEIPVDPDDLFYRFYPYPNRQNEEGKQDFIVVAVYRSMITPVLKALHAAGLIIYSFGLEPESLYLGLRHHGVFEQVDHTVLIVRTDTKQMMLAVFSGGKIMYSRYRPLTSNPEDLEQEIERTLLSWNGKHTQNRIQEVILLGDQANWQDIKDRIRNFIPIPVQVFEQPFTACSGVALKERDEINLYGDDHALPWKKGITRLAPLALILFIVAGHFIYQYRTYQSLQTDVIRLKQDINQHRSIVAWTEQNTRLKTVKEQLDQQLAEIRKRDASPLTVIDIVVSQQPEGVILSQVAFTIDEIHITGIAPSQKEVLLYLEELQQDPRLSYVQLKNASTGTSGTLFSISIKRNREDVIQ